MVQVKALIKGVNDEIIELIEESSIFAVDSVSDLINTLFKALMIIPSPTYNSFGLGYPL